MTFAIEAEGLAKLFGTTPALRGIDLAAPTGSVLGLLRPERLRQDHRRADPRDAAAAGRRQATVDGYDVTRRSYQTTTSTTNDGTLLRSDDIKEGTYSKAIEHPVESQASPCCSVRSLRAKAGQASAAPR